MSANVESMFSVREVPWHGMGIIVDNALDSKEAIRVAGLDWDVVQQPAAYKVGDVYQDTDYILNIRATDNSVLGMVSKQYRIVQNREAFEFTDALLENGDVRYETAGSLFGGRVVWLLAKLSPKEILGDKFMPYLLFSNAHDGSGAVRVAQTPVRVVCANTLNLALDGNVRSISFSHVGDIKEKLGQAKLLLSRTEEYWKELEENAESLYKKKLSQRQVSKIIDRAFPLKVDEATPLQLENMSRLRERFYACLKADDIQNFVGTGWGLIQATSDFAYHARPIRVMKTFQDYRMMKVINGNKLLDSIFGMIQEAA